ncbi:MAG: methylmalonyl-CoA mutase family protein [Chthoniobacterales bacterium]
MSKNLFAEQLDLSEFSASTLADWKVAAEATLKGKPLEKLTSQTPDGLKVEPIYQPENTVRLPGAENDPGVFPYVRGTRSSVNWHTVDAGTDVVPARWSNVAADEIHEAGGSAVQEVAFAWAAGLKLLREAESVGLSVDEAAGRLRFTFAAGGEFFVALAKLRAARFGWARIVTACGGSPEAARMVIHARTSRWQQSSLDPHTNMLRSTVSAYAAVLGGCDSLEVSPFDEVFREPDNFSRRIAHNTQTILRDECRADAVADPAGGSWFVESLTREIAEAAWGELQKSEQEGGEDGVSKSAQKQRNTLSQRRRIMVGVNQYADPGEQPLPATRRTGAERLAGGFEQLRANARAFAARQGDTPKIFLLTMGPVRQHKARADFVRGFLEPGGFAVLYPSGFETAEAAAQAARESGALAAVLCSTDETYPELVPAVLTTLGGKLPVFLAGYPAEHVASFQAAGISDFIHVKADCGAFLAAWQQKLGVLS